MSEHAQRAHAILSASGSSRWMACPPSALLEEKFPDKDTEFSKEGTLAHEIAECILRTIPSLRPKGDGWMKWHEKHVAIGQTMDDKTFNEFRNYLHNYTGMVEAVLFCGKSAYSRVTLMWAKFYTPTPQPAVPAIRSRQAEVLRRLSEWSKR